MPATLSVALTIAGPAEASSAQCPLPTVQPSATATGDLQLVLRSVDEKPVISSANPGLEGNDLEGAIVVRVGGLYRFFATEQKDIIDTRFAEWTSPDGISWRRRQTLMTSTGRRDGSDPRASLWSPMVVFDPEHQRWNMFYIGYYSRPQDGTGRWYGAYDGHVIRALSSVQGANGVDGPYVDRGVVLRPSVESEAWEGLQGSDSFFPFRIGNRWMGFYGSASTEFDPIRSWRVGLASSATLAGPWVRCPQLNPSPIEPHFVENPIVYRVPQAYVAIYDVDVDDPHAIGYAFSADGLHWDHGHRLNVQPRHEIHIRTPVGLLPRGDGTYVLFFTAIDRRSTARHGDQAVQEQLFRSVVSFCTSSTCRSAAKSTGSIR